MSNQTPLLEACPLRPISQAGEQYAADIIRGLNEELATAETAADFLETTHLTRAAGDFLRMAMDRVALGRDSTSPSVYQLYSRYGGGKTHSLLLLAAAAKYPHLTYWQDTAQMDPASAKVIAFDGEKHNPEGTELDQQGTQARSLAGYLLYHLGGSEALKRFREGDAILADPGSDEFRRLIGDEPVVIVIDELVHYISRVNQRVASDSRISAEGVLTTVSALANAVVNSPKAVLVITTPEDSHELLDDGIQNAAGDAMSVDTLALIGMLDRINSQLGRVIYPVAPAGEADLPAILRKRLFYSVDEAARQDTANAYAAVTTRNGRANGNLDYQGFYDAYPFHPWLLNIITSRLAANRNFQRVRGTLRLLGNTLLEMQNGSGKPALVHPYHATLRVARIRDEVVNRPGFSELDPAIDTDIVGSNSTAEKTGNDLAEPAAVTMLLGTIAPENSNGLYADHIADALLSPERDDFGVIANAIEQFLSRAIYVDDSPDTQRKRFSKDANVMKELLEARDAMLANTTAMTDLLRQAITSAYGSGNRRGDQFEVMLFPSRQSNVPDNPDQAILGIVNPDHWNWTDAGNPANGMNNQDLLDLHRHSSGNDGDASRQYPNNALLLAAHDANLSRIREDIATMEAADRLLKETTRPLPQHRRDTLESIRATSEKNATTGIQNKFTHLFSAGNTQQHQWPEPHSHLEQRTLESITDAAGKGQDGVLQALGDRVLRGAAAGLSKTAWSRVGIITNEQGSTLGELRDYFARTPDARIIINDATWRAMVANGVANDALHVVTPSGEVSPSGYDPSWRVWVKGHEPQPEPGGGTESSGTTNGSSGGGTQTSGTNDVGNSSGAGSRQTTFNSGKMAGRAAYEAVKRFMDDNGHDWSSLAACQVKGTSATLADQIASIAQGDDSGIAITMRAQNQRLQVGVTAAPPSEFKDYSGPAKRMMSKAGVSVADVSVELEPDDARRVLEKLNNRDEANISVSFR